MIKMAGGCDPKAFLLGISKVSGTRGSAWVFIKLKVFMLRMKLNSIKARGVLTCTNRTKNSTVTLSSKPDTIRVTWERSFAPMGTVAWFKLNFKATFLSR